MQKRILIAALNWGLGHASRSIPIIRSLQNQGAKIFLAADGRAAKLWEAEFPNLMLAQLPGYYIEYPSSNLSWHLARQLPTVWKAIRQEQKITQDLVDQWNIDGIISDHRYGCFDKRVPCMFVCHQMKILAPNYPAELLINLAHRYFLKNFTQHWVPDFPESPGLGGRLSHEYQTAKSIFIGPLSRMEQVHSDSKWDYLAILSGPEPQRSFLENEILVAAKGIPGNWLIIGGKTEVQENKLIQSNISYRSFLDSKELEQTINSSKIIICRSGYSSIMDLTALGKRAILIPTQGQTEQEYLAKLHGASAQFVISAQGNLNLETTLRELEKQKEEGVKKKDDLLQTVLQQFLESL